ncbi:MULTISPECIES: type II toxin-antitoxin system RelE/ParE family toxin [Herbaspirillum]|uniref:type II toxin-antitoxin system RelE/ParE family toxin n=1 Tax=Herbaspirillum TaxID=963 RepID=UPI00286CE5D6|nr:type II toxin-antitoxin system RelE/ParE family toxin [Herbaspirillum frisingense]
MIVIVRLQSGHAPRSPTPAIYNLATGNQGRQSASSHRCPDKKTGARPDRRHRTRGGRVSELRIHLGAGWRVYYTQRGSQIIVLLAGGSKRTQASDIKRAKQLAALLE